ncbi:hypothetical protein BSF44_12200 [Pseudomonas sp. ACN8]|nr:hypothetical protein BSF44_12200 [Pseudomonas sp. ACN8]
MDVNDNACFLNVRGACKSIASRLAPTIVLWCLQFQCLRHNPPNSNNKDAFL